MGANKDTKINAQRKNIKKNFYHHPKNLATPVKDRLKKKLEERKRKRESVW